MAGVPRHPGEDLDRRADRAEGARDARGPAQLRGRPRGEDVAGRRGDEQRADQVRAAALVLLRALLAVLVRPDRDVLGAVVGGELAAAEREHGRRERERAREELARDVAEPVRAADDLDGHRARERRREHVGPLEGQPRLGQLAPQLGEDRERLGQPHRPAQERLLDPRREQPLARGGHLDLARVGADRAGPGGRPVHEHAVASAMPPRRILLLMRWSVATAARLSAACSSSAAGPRPIGAPSSSTTGITSRTDEEVNASSASGELGERVRALLDVVAGAGARARAPPPASRRRGCRARARA